MSLGDGLFKCVVLIFAAKWLLPIVFIWGQMLISTDTLFKFVVLTFVEKIN